LRRLSKGETERAERLGVLRSSRWLLGSGLFVLLCIVLLNHLCRSTTEAADHSPGAIYVARLEQSDCGATTRFQTYVIIAEAKSRFGLPGFGHRSENVFTLLGASSHIKLHWNSDTELVVECNACQAKDRRVWKSNWETVSVKYAFN
jgi:hypothetical protein